MYQKEQFQFLSSNNVNQVHAFVYRPEREIRALVQLVHGMCEHLERYEPYIAYLTKQGFLVYGDNHLGHKYTASIEQDLGYFAPENGWQCLVEDEHTLNGILKEKYPNLPVFLYGHSMGSFVARAYTAKYGTELTGVIFSGTAGSNKALGMGKAFTKFVKACKGERHYSPTITFLMFGSYNKKYKNPRTAYDWLTRDEEVVNAYLEDPYCGFMFTTSGYLDLINLLEYVTGDSWYQELPKTLPMFFIGGTMDPVGNWGAGYYEIDEKMAALGCTDYSMKLYKDMRHELHNEIGKEQVWQDVTDWFNQHL